VYDGDSCASKESNVNLAYAALALLSQADVAPAPASSGFQFGVWRWVVIIGVGAVIVIYAIHRISVLVARQKTARLIDDVVGREEAASNTGWVEEDKDKE